MRYARTTYVSSDKSVAEIKKILSRYGASSFAFFEEGAKAAIAFKAQNRSIRMLVPLPDPKDFEKSPAGRKWPRERGLKAWDKLERPDWMLWLANAVNADLCKDERKLRHFAADCAEDVLPIFEKERPDDKRPRLVIQAARDFADGKIGDAARAAAGAAARAAAGAAARAKYSIWLRKTFKKIGSKP